MQIVNWNELTLCKQEEVLRRPNSDNRLVQDKVRKIIETIATDGDAAIMEYSRRFDAVAASRLQVDPARLQTCWQQLAPVEQDYMRRAYDNIKAFHKAQLPKSIRIEIEPGLIVERISRAVDCVGIYVPGGNAPLFSSLLMAAIPAKLAGVRKIIIASPPDEEGEVATIILAAAFLCGIDEVYCMGGAQAIAAMGLGTQSVPRADKLVGPGNQWVNAAKAQISQLPEGPAIDLPAGPSEVMVLADTSAKPAWVAADLLSQAEHDPIAQVILLSDSEQTLKDVEMAVKVQLQELPRKKIAAQSLQSARLILVQNTAQMLDIVNRYAPEHLIIQTENPRKMLAGIRNAGSIFVGPYTPEALGDYASGTNHVLPTAGAARSYSGLGTQSFVKFITVQEASKPALESLGPVVRKLAQMETLEAHARAISIRLEAEQ